MDKYILYSAEYDFLNIVWELQPTDLTELVELCHKRFGWSKSITKTAVQKLSERGFLRIENSSITAIVPKEYVQFVAGEPIPWQLYKRPKRKFLPSFLERFKMKGLLNYRKLPFWILLSLLVVLVVCVNFFVGYSARASRISAAEDIGSQISQQVDDLVFPDCFIAGKRSITLADNTLCSIDFFFEIDGKSKSQNAFDVIRDNHESLDVIASTICSRIDGPLVIDFIIFADEYSGRVEYVKTFDEYSKTDYSIYAYSGFYDDRDALFTDLANAKMLNSYSVDI